jgi:hypothetical protein
MELGQYSRYRGWATGCTDWGLNPGSENSFFSTPNGMDRLCGTQSLLFSVKQGSFLVGAKWPERDVDHSYLAPSFRMTGILPLFLLCFYGVGEKNFTL